MNIGNDDLEKERYFLNNASQESLVLFNDRFDQLMAMDTIDLERLRKLAWKGVPGIHRAQCWKLLLNYTSPIKSKQRSSHQQKKSIYARIKQQHFGPHSQRDAGTMHQIAIDVPRTAPDLPFMKSDAIRECIARCLYCASVRRPAAGYVQGMNDLIIPFFKIFLDALQLERQRKSDHFIDTLGVSVETISETADPSPPLILSTDDLDDLETDCFWCASQLLDLIQDNYTSNQTGIIRKISKMKKCLESIDPALSSHFEEEGVQFVQFAFRWMNNLLFREFPLPLLLRIWDTLLAEGGVLGDGDGDGFTELLPYLCVSLLRAWREDLINEKFQEIIIFLQNPPTEKFTNDDISVLMSEAFLLKSLFQNSRR